MGTEYVENATGEDGCISKDCALWTPDIKHRAFLAERLGNTHAGNGQPKAKYLSYLIYGNMILMCPGYNVCLLYTSPSPRDIRRSRMPSSA